MSITLNSTLKTAQDSNSHRPIIEIMSVGMVDDIPFDGQYLTTETTNEQKPNIIFHSSGRLISVYIYGTTYVEFVKTDASRTEFIHTRLTQSDLGCSGETIIEASICELTDSNIGIVFITSSLTNFRLRYAVLTISGTVSDSGLIETYDKSSYSDLKSPFVLTLANDTYYLVYILDDISNLSKIYKRTSANFTAWSAEGEISLTGLSTNTKKNISIYQIDNGNMFLMLDYYNDTNYSNIYYSISTDNGSTWSAAIALTSYTDASARGLHPIAYQKLTDTINIIFYEESTALWMDDETDGMPDISKLSISDITINSDTSKAYLVVSHIYSGSKVLYAVIEIDILTWEVTNYWDTETTPAFASDYAEKHIWWMSHTGYKNIIPIAMTRDISYKHIAVLNVTEDTITHYNITDHADELQQNLSWLSWGRFGRQTPYQIFLTHIDNLERLWVIQAAPLSGQSGIDIFYIDLNEESYLVEGETYYYIHQIVRDSNVTQPQASANKCFFVEYTNNYIYLSMTGYAGYPGRFKIYDMTKETTYSSRELYPDNTKTYLVEIDTGLAIGDFVWSAGSQLPRKGLKRFLVSDDTIYGIFNYESEYDEDTKRGLCEIITEKSGDYINVKEVNYYRPTWATYDDYLFADLKFTSDNKILISSSYGITLFDPITKEWELFDNANYPGLTSNDEDNFFTLGYDSTTNMVLTGRFGATDVNDLVGFSLDGPMKKTYYLPGTYDEGWSFNEKSEMIQAYNDYEAVVAINPTDKSLYIFWTNQLLTELSIKWDYESGIIDLTPYLLRSIDIVLKWSIDNVPGELSFGVSHGHLFDPYNNSSLLSAMLTKDRKITVRIGEEVSGVEYWQNQGTFFVESYKMSGYERGKYPEASVKCKDVMSLLSDIECITTDYYDIAAESVIEDILENKAGIESEDIEDFSFDNSATIYVQWLDTPVMTMISEICDRFGYFAIIDMDNKFTCRKIANDNSVVHTYSNQKTIIRWSPNDDYADKVNRIIVIGEERDFSETVYPEEPIVTKAGTAGWWSGGERIKCYYSEDMTRKCKYPRLDWLMQPTGLGIWRDNLDAYIEEDDDQLGAELIIDAPNLIGRLLYLLSLIGAKWAIPDEVSGSSTIPIGRLAEGALLIAIFDVLTAVTNWQATIYARPVGYVRRSIQAIADDEDHQRKTNKIMPKKIDEPMCYTVAQCQEVADHERMLKQLQRRQITLSKIMHLQDEVGDTIRIKHPFSNQNMDIYITTLTRRYKMPTRVGENDGKCIDDIEAWKLNK